jgi:hypothetical protein
MPSTPDHPNKDAENLGRRSRNKIARNRERWLRVRVAHAAVGEQSGIPSVVVAGPFQETGQVTAYDQGVPSLRVAVSGRLISTGL